MKCKKHPKYKAMRKPTSGCETCMVMFKNAEYDRAARQETNSRYTWDDWKEARRERIAAVDRTHGRP